MTSKETSTEQPSSSEEPQDTPPPEQPAAETDDASQAEKFWEDKYHDIHDQYIRLAADFENFRKRYSKEREALLKYGAERTATELLPTLDNLERAMTSLSEESEAKMLYQSFKLLSSQLLESLSAGGIQKMNSIGQSFDPTYHEAVSKAPSPDHPEDIVIYETETGYMLHDRVLRPAKVIVSSGQPSSEIPQGEPTQEEGFENPFQQAGS